MTVRRGKTKTLIKKKALSGAGTIIDFEKENLPDELLKSLPEEPKEDENTYDSYLNITILIFK